MTIACRDEWLFAPQVTVIGGIPTPSTTPPVFVSHVDLVLTYPFVSPTQTVTLRAPKLGDTHQVTVEAVRQQTMGGVTTMGRNGIWPIVDIYNFQFDGLPNDVIEAYFAFAILTAGQIVGLRDHLGRLFYGFILNPDGESNSEQVCNNSLEISFRGTLSAEGV